MTPLRLSVVIPALNEAAGIQAALQALAPLVARGAQIIVADSGSQDGTAGLAQAGGAQVVHAPRGRALQMNAGAQQASGELLLFLHADTRLPPDADRLIEQALASGPQVWGRFDVRIEGQPRMLRVIGACGDEATRVENRIGEPAANPYLYFASQIHAGLDGMARELKAPPATDAS